MATTNYANMNTGMQAYKEEVAKKCPLNSTCSFCTCRCCGFCILIFWVLFGAIGGIIDFNAIGNGYDYDVCPTNTGDITGECCGFESTDDTIIVIPGTCSNYDTSVTISGVDSIC